MGLKKSFITVALILGATSIFLQPIFAADTQQANGSCCTKQNPGCGLALTNDQKAQMKSIRENTRSQVKAVRSDNSLTQDQKKAKIKEIMESSRAQIRQILTPEQQAKFDKMQALRASRRQERREEYAALNLTKDQKARMEAIRRDGQSKIAEVRQNTSLTQEQKRAQIKSIVKESMAQCRQVLTPDQLKKLKEMRQEARQSRGCPNTGKSCPGGACPMK